ncbi:bifunctional Glycine cleavage system H-protein-Simiate/Single hybrid motif [Babesia duncani]|uniref:Bifunctional Glycine cleavage system H-protein-Simiate/Single hybrid motif n=1 Tax=Babesia duncani TaxID=323732 RepID=A0AAD9UPK7_9APIC|nr:bifunctional Glycine cleavage system H-protein-Simiate/Single hybrid motif [Babesia duncani]
MKELEFISFTKNHEIKKDEHLFSVEAAKTLYEFASPVDAEIMEINKKFLEPSNPEHLSQFSGPTDSHDYPPAHL